ncbi:MAG: 4Fe-4S dicluster domain-containing protein [Deinococcales bacterium]|nr:4Fe-4S dicluster domain-containing protein [Deinococcales bacterium]
MALLGDLFEMVMKAVEVAPAVTPERCLNAGSGAGTCTACVDACPHEAVSLVGGVAVDAVDCTGCGLCVRACPSQALELDVRVAGGAAARCSQVGGSAQSVVCLAQLSPTDLLRLAGTSGELTLARGACAGCQVGDASVPAVVDAAVAEAGRLAAQLGRELTVDVAERPRLDDERHLQRRVSRRQLFGGGLRETRRLASDALAPLERLLPAPPAEDERRPLPTELQRRYRALEIAEPAPETLVPWRLPRVADGCIMCPACTRACPTDALRRDFTDPQGALLLDPERCVGCDACVSACPVKVVSMDDQVTWAELASGTQEAYRPSPDRRPEGSFHR